MADKPAMQSREDQYIAIEAAFQWFLLALVVGGFSGNNGGNAELGVSYLERVREVLGVDASIGDQTWRRERL